MSDETKRVDGESRTDEEQRPEETAAEPAEERKAAGREKKSPAAGTARKKTGKSGGAAEKAPAEVVARKRTRRFTKRRLNTLLDEMLGQFAEQVAGKEVRFTANEGLKIYQIRKELAPREKIEVEVGWVTPKER